MAPAMARRSLPLLALTLLALFLGPSALSFAKTVVVTGAGGRTGILVVGELLDKGYEVRALVHSKKSKEALLSKYKALPADRIYVADIQDKASLQKAFAGCAAAIVATSAVPKLKVWSLLPFMVKKLFGKKGKLRFSWKGDGKPEKVDWEGQRNQFEMASEEGVQQVVLVGTMTGTQKDSFLNSIGEGEGDQIVMWKRKAEVFLIDLCKKNRMKYTIIHAGGLSDEPGGQAPVKLGVDDKLREVKNLRIPRADIARACVQALECDLAKDRSFDMTSVEGGQALGEDGLKKLLQEMGDVTCDYSINPPP